MSHYVFILGRNPGLSQAELTACLGADCLVRSSDVFVLAELENVECEQLLRRLGGTIKIGRVVSDFSGAETLAENFLSQQPAGKIIFGISYYDPRARRQFPHNRRAV